MKGKGIVKKILATIILSLMLFASCSQVISYAATIKVRSTRENGNKYAIKSPWSNTYTVSDYRINDADAFDCYCLRGNLTVNQNTDAYTQGKVLETFANAEEFENATGVVLRDNFKYNSAMTNDNYKIKSKDQSLRALQWLARNMYLVLPNGKVDDNQKNLMRENINYYIDKYCDTNDGTKSARLGTYITDDEIISVIQQFIVWKFLEPYPSVNNDQTNVENYYKNNITSVSDIKKISINGNYITDNNIAIEGYALYKALCKAAIQYGNGLLNDNLKKYGEDGFNKFGAKKGTDNKIVIVDEGTRKYKTGNITLNGSNIKNVGIQNLKLENAENGTILNSWKVYGRKSESTGGYTELLNSNSNSSILADLASKLNNANQEIYIEFTTNKLINDNTKISFNFNCEYKTVLNAYNSYVYSASNPSSSQPILGISKTLKNAEYNPVVTIGFDMPEFDLALIKNIDSIFRYNGSTQKYESIYYEPDEVDSNNNPTSEKRYFGRDTSSYEYKMNKEAKKVNAGDIIRYRIRVFNEGAETGYVKQISDYLPNGLTLLSVNETVSKDAISNNNLNNVTTENKNGFKIVKYKYTDNNNKGKKIENSDENNSNQIINLYIECLVDDNVSAGTKLMNIAAITDYGYYSENNYIQAAENTAGSIDLDSDKKVYTGYPNYINYINNRINNVTSINNGINKNELVDQDDEDFEQVEIGGFDLALRKYITKIGNEEITGNNSREPKFNSFLTKNNWIGSAYYIHKKAPLEVKNGDTVEYTIRVYNEGYIDGKVTEIKDYLPNGLTLKDNSTINSEYGWQTFYGDSGKSYIYTTKDLGTIKASKGSEGFAKLSSNNLNEEDKFWVDYKVECVVNTTNITNGTILTNFAEISKCQYEYYTKEANGVTKKTVKSTDIDSTPDNVLGKLSDAGKSQDTNGYYEYQEKGNYTKYILNRSIFYGLEDDDDFENIIVRDNTFDLALRKYITAIDRNGTHPGFSSRVPEVDASNIMQSGTAEYNHIKTPLKVQKGDIITYGIRIYNEGYTAGKVKEITDYLPEGLEFIDDNNGWSLVNGTNNIIKYNTEITIQPTNRFEQATSNRDNFEEVTVRCRVTSVVDGTILTNVAEISNYEDINGNKASTEANADIDSQYNNKGRTIYPGMDKSIDEQIKEYYDAKGVDATYTKPYYPGKQDDDDFESVLVDAKYSADFTLEKTDENDPNPNNPEFLEGSKFLVYRWEKDQEDTTIVLNDLSNKKKIISSQNPLDSTNNTNEMEDLVVGKDYVFIVEEKEAPEGYNNLFNKYKILVPVYIDNDEQIKIGCKNGSYNGQFIIINKKTNEVLDSSNELYNKVTVTADNSNGRKIKVSVKNPKISGAYNFLIKKIDEENHMITEEKEIGLAFTFDRDVYEETSQNQFDKKSSETETINIDESDGWGRKYNIPIEEIGYDEITITEFEDDTNKYIELGEPIILRAYKKTKVVNGENIYYIDDIKIFSKNGVEYTDTEGYDSGIDNVVKEFKVKAKLKNDDDDEEEIYVYFRLKEKNNVNTIVVVVPDKKIEGSYGLRIEKIGKNDETKLENVKFSGYDNDDNEFNDITTNSYGVATIVSNKAITEESIEWYDITETSTDENYELYNKSFRVYVKHIIEGNVFKTRYSLDFNTINDNTEDKHISDDGMVSLSESDGIISVKVENKPITGKYQFKVRKVDNSSDRTPISGVNFDVAKNDVTVNTYGSVKSDGATNEYGKVVITGNDESIYLDNTANRITIDNVDSYDKFKISEINLNGKPYAKLKDPVTVFIKKGIVGEGTEKRYEPIAIAFDSEANFGEENKTLIYKDNVELENSDVKVKLAAKIYYADQKNKTTVVRITIPNEELTGEYDLEIVKTKADGVEQLEGARFTVNKVTEKENNGEGNSSEEAQEVRTPVELATQDNGKTYVTTEQIPIDQENKDTIDVFEIKEEETNENYIKLGEDVRIYVKKSFVPGTEETTAHYEITASFNKDDFDSDIYKSKKLSLEYGTKQVNAKVSVENGKVVVTIPNEPITGTFDLFIKKIDDKGKPVAGAKFNVNDATNNITTKSNEPNKGIATVVENKEIEINEENSNEKIYNYKIKEVYADNANVIRLKDPFYIYVKTERIANEAYKVTGVSFDQNKTYGTDIESDEVELNKGELKTKLKAKVEYSDDNPTKGIITITVPNKIITGSYNLEIIKEDEDDTNNKLLSGAKFTVEKVKDDGTAEQPIVDKIVDNEEATDGSLVKEKIEIEDRNVIHHYKITENETNKDYLKLKESFDIYVKTSRHGTDSNDDPEPDEYKVDSVSFTGNENDFGTTKKLNDVNLIDGETKVDIKAEIVGNTVKITVPNKKLEGSYGIEILKVDDNNKDKTIEGAEFTIIDSEDAEDGEDGEENTATTGEDGEGTETTGEDGEESTATTDENGKAVIAENVPIYGESVNNKEKDKYTIKEFKAENYLKLAEPFDIYVSKGANEAKTAFVATGVSFSEDKKTKTKATSNAELVGGETVEVTAEIIDGNVLITVPNKPIEGQYSLQIRKTDEKDEPLGNVEFKVEEGTEQVKIKEGSTDNDGVLEIFKDRAITSANLDTPEIFTIKEIATNGNYVAIPEDEDITVYVYRGLNKAETAYEVKAVSFEEIDFSEEDGSFEEDDVVTTKNVELPNGKEITLYLNVKNGMVTVTIPNHKIEGKFDFELIKIDQKDGESVLPGVKFDIKTMINDEEVTLYNVDGKEIKTTGLTTNKKGKIVLSNVNITKGAKYTFEITETNVPEGYVMLRDPLTLEFTTEVDEETQTFVIGDASLSGVGDLESSSNKITVTVQNGEFDLALRKFASSVTVYAGTEQEKTVTVPNREPVFKIDEDGNYTYEHSKDTILVGSESLVEYTLRVYNEGSISGYAKEIKDDIPDGLEFLPENETNQEYGWILVDEEGNEVKEVNKAKYIVTNYLSKEAETVEGENLIEAFDVKAFEAGEIKEPNYMDVKVVFKVTMPNTDDRIVINKAQISDDSDKDGEDVTDKDSTPDEWIEGEDDQDTEELKVQYFDLSLRKWITNVITIEDGKENSVATGHKAEDDPEEIVKVDLKDSKINDVVVKFAYKIRVKNEGEIAGYAKEISDYIPQGLKFDAAENPNWKEVEGKIVTEELKDTLLKPGDTAEVEVILTWINRKDNLGLKENVAEISKDYNVFGTPDIDSTPNNQVPGEDDIDDAKVLLTVKTGEAVTYVGLAIAVLAILGSGIVLIKKYVIK